MKGGAKLDNFLLLIPSNNIRQKDMKMLSILNLDSISQLESAASMVKLIY